MNNNTNPCPVSAATGQRENIEWSISYAYHVTDGNKTLPRVLLVGDSICNAYRDGVRELLEGKANVTFWVSSYSVTRPEYLRLLAFMLDADDYAAVHFNNGLHSLGDDTAEWAAALEKALLLIRAKRPSAKIVWAASTPLTDPGKTAKAAELNAAGADVAARLGGIATDDLFALLDPLDRETFWCDTYHHTPEARDMEARQVADCVLAAIGGEISEVAERGGAPAAPRRVLCWGDSVTEGMAMPRGKDYPGQLQKLLGSAYQVFNSGDGGENSITIPARQGAVPLTTAGRIAFGAGESSVKIGDAGDNGFRTPLGDKIKLTMPLGRQIPINPVKIAGREFTLSFRDFRWNTPTSPISYTLWLSRDEAASGAPFEIPAGAAVEFASAGAVRDAYCEIVFMGGNGGWGGDIDRLIAQIREMIAIRGEDKPYLVLVPYWAAITREQKDAFKAAFGRHAVEFPVEDSLCYMNRPDVHLNECGYSLLASLLHERGAELGYWR